MDKNSVIGIILIAAILIVYSIISKPSREEIAEQRRISDSLSVKENKAAVRDVTADSLQPAIPRQISDSGSVIELQTTYGIFAPRSQGTEEFYTIENDLIKLTLSNKGGRPYAVELKKYRSVDSSQVTLFSGDSALFGLEFFSDGKSIRTTDLYFASSSNEKSLSATDSPVTLAFALPVDSSGAKIEYVYTLSPGSYLVDFDMRMVGMSNHRTDNVQLSWQIYSRQLEKGRQNEVSYTNLFYRYFEGDVEKFKAGSKKDVQEATETTKLEWVSFKQQFFSSIIRAKNIPFEGGYMASEAIEQGKYLRKFTAELSVPYDRSENFHMPFELYFGPNHFQTLKNIGHEYQELVIIGSSIIKWINAYVVIPLFNWLDNFIGSYGIIILLLTVIIKIGLLPLTYKSYISTAKMRVLKPQIDEVNAKIPKEKAMERQQAAMALYKKVGVNPLGGCLPMLLQLPILYAMFRFFPASIELRQEHFLWADDLSTYDSILSLPFNIPMYGNHVSLFTLLMTITTILSMKMTPQASGTDAAMPGMKTMMYIMPVMFMLILNNFAAGLNYYYFLSNVIGLAQNYLFKFVVDEKELLRKLNSKKSKPVKKSGFQERLEDMAKKRGYKLPK